MTIQEFSKEKNISTNKAVKMAPRIEGSTQCPCCKKWIFPDTAKAIYIPDKRKYSPYVRPYCYVLDAIALDMDLVSEVSFISDDIRRTVVRELAKNELIVLKDGCDNQSLYHLDYILSLRLIEWQERTNKEKSKLILETINSCAYALGKTAEAVTTVAKTVK
jgi:hypothetical protein